MYKFLIILLLLFSCSVKQKETPIDPLFIQKLVENKIEGFPWTESGHLFAKGENDSILLIEDCRILEEIYDQGPYNISYEDFLTLALNQKIILKPQFSVPRLYLDKKITAKYRSENFDVFFDTYCKKKSEGNWYRLKRDVSDNELYTIMYYLFINNLITFSDCYSGTYSVGNIAIIFRTNKK